MPEEDADAMDGADRTDSPDKASQKPWFKRWPVLAAGAAGVLGAVYLGDLAATAGEMPRDVIVAGVDVGGLDRADAEKKLRAELEPNLQRPVQVSAGDKRAAIEPDVAHVDVDWAGTVDNAAAGSNSPWGRVKSLFTDRELDVVASGDAEAVAGRLDKLAGEVDRSRTEGTIRYEGTTPKPVAPRAGRKLDVKTSTEQVLAQWAAGRPVAAKVDELPVKATAEGVDKTIKEFAEPAVSAPVEIEARGKTTTLKPTQIASVLTFTANDDGSLEPAVDASKLKKAIGPDVAKQERKPKNARFVFRGKKASVTKSAEGMEVAWAKTGERLVDVLGKTGERSVEAEFESREPKYTTDELQGLGVKEVIGEFTTGGFAYDSGQNIKTMADQVDGAIVRPGATFSLNDFTGKRGIDEGYIDAGVIKEGEMDRAVGGGISQFATTLYNAYYFAGLKDVEHKEHSFYIGRYPMGREATVFQNPDGSSVIDLKFRNEEDTGVVIQTIWTPSDITIKLWGTKRYKVESKTSEGFAYTTAPVKNKELDPECKPQPGVNGWSVNDVRIIRELDGDEVDRQKRTVVYDPQPQIVCGDKKDPEGEGEGEVNGNPANGGN